MSLIITPDHPDFYIFLHSKLPPGSIAQCYAPDADTGILKPMSEAEEIEYEDGNREDFSDDYVVDY